jgi:hypothetical protein
MPALSLYAFERDAPDRGGQFWQNHISHGAGSWAWATISNLPDVHATLAWERPDNELIIDLSAAANNPLALSVIDRLLPSPASRRGPVRTSYVTWANVHPGVRAGNPGLHQDWELLGTINVDFHVSTPWYCSDADGTITYYVFFYVDSGGQVRARVEGWSYHYDGGGPVCTGAINDALNGGVPDGVGSVQSQIDLALALFGGGRTFSMIYFLPGHGARSGFSSDNADNNVALALLPA